MTVAPAHPAKFSAAVLDRIHRALHEHHIQPARILDPFAGTGRVQAVAERIGVPWVGVELEPEWLPPGSNVVGNALTLPFPDRSFDCLVTSPCYGNRQADHHHARDKSVRNTYRHLLARPLHCDNSGLLQWGAAYRGFHALTWREVGRCLTDDAWVLLNLSNHIRGGREQLVAEWHLAWWLEHGYQLIETAPITTPRLRYGQNRDLRVNHEWLFVLHANL